MPFSSLDIFHPLFIIYCTFLNKKTKKMNIR